MVSDDHVSAAKHQWRSALIANRVRSLLTIVIRGTNTTCSRILVPRPQTQQEVDTAHKNGSTPSSKRVKLHLQHLYPPPEAAVAPALEEIPSRLPLTVATIPMAPITTAARRTWAKASIPARRWTAIHRNSITSTGMF
jgi:hypothetical protein